MVDARRPGTVICLVVLGPEWLQAEARTHKALGNDKVIRDERLSHTARLRPTRARRSQTFPGARTVLGSCAGAEPRYARKVGIHLVIAFVFRSRSGRTSALAARRSRAAAIPDERNATIAIARSRPLGGRLPCRRLDRAGCQRTIGLPQSTLLTVPNWFHCKSTSLSLRVGAHLRSHRFTDVTSSQPGLTGRRER